MRGNRDGCCLVPSHSRNGEKRRPVPLGVREELARQITGGAQTRKNPGTPVALDARPVSSAAG